MRELPNMGETPKAEPSKLLNPTTSSTPVTVDNNPPPTNAAIPSSSEVKKSDPTGDVDGGWVEMVWQKWRWGLFIAFAVLVSRLSSNPN